MASIPELRTPIAIARPNKLFAEPEKAFIFIQRFRCFNFLGTPQLNITRLWLCKDLFFKAGRGSR
jgi:hypothetical protein